MDKQKQTRARPADTRRRPPMSTYYRSGAKSGAAGQGSPFEKKVKKPSKLGKYFARAIDILLILSLSVGLIYSLIVSPSATVQVSDTTYHSFDNYSDSAKHYLKAFKNRNKISFDEASIAKSYKQDYPEIDNVSVELPVFGEKPIINIRIAKPSFFLNSGGQIYLIDSNGKAIGYAKSFKVSSNLPTLSDKSNYPISIGKAVISTSDVRFTKSLLAESARVGVKLKDLTLPNVPAELDVTPAGKPYIVKFYLLGDARTQIGQFLAAMHEFDKTGKQPTQYLDVRVSGKIFYK
ncbi:hypothetical protein KW789_02530 [Candidatus Saccharibacteria bacterium]|jgi:hypothetical protein|nr:hypothetical protein [Candidatus Saccharibacteria bacterium]